VTPAADQPPPSGRFHGDAIAMGELRVARDGGTLRTFLGSCVGLALHDRRRRAAGLAHVMLPDSQGRDGPPGKYADTALAELLRLLDAVSAAGRTGLVAKIAGGARMFDFSAGTPIGDQNVLAIERILDGAGIPIVGRDCGGRHGRRMSFDVESGVVTIEAIGTDTKTI
jgi:chemotaxis protein CheD